MIRKFAFTSAFAILVLMLAGCPGSSSSGGKESRFIGTYVNANDPKMSIQLKADHKAVLDGTKEATWEVAGDDKAIVHGEMNISLELLRNADGSLRDTMGGGDWKKK